MIRLLEVVLQDSLGRVEKIDHFLYRSEQYPHVLSRDPDPGIGTGLTS